MSDRVGYPVGNTNGRDHIPWPMITPAQAVTFGYTPRTTGLSLAQIMALSWRVKKWDCSGSADIAIHQVINRTSPTRTEIYDLTAAFAIPSFQMEIPFATTEKDLVSLVGLWESGFRTLVNPGFDGGVNQNVSTTQTLTWDFTPPELYGDPSGTETSTTNRPLVLNAGLFAGPGNDDEAHVIFDNGLFYPKFIVSALLTSQHYEALITFSTEQGGGDGTLTIDPGVAASFTVPIEAGGRVRNSVGSAITAVGSVSMTMTATEFWPYANSGGLPIYDTLSGGQLRSPFS